MFPDRHNKMEKYLDKSGDRPIILVFDPFPSLYPTRLAQNLAKKYDFDTYIVSNLQTHSEIYRKLIGLTVISNKGIDLIRSRVILCIVYSDQRPQWKLYKKYFENIKTIFLERGLLRGDFCQASFNGVNSRSGLGQRKLGDFRERLPEYPEINRNTDMYCFFERGFGYKFFIIILIFFGFIEIKLMDFLGKKNLFHQNLSLFRYLNRFIKKASYIEIKKSDKFPTLLVALQLESDTQFQEQSLFESNKEFVTYLLTVIENRSINLCIKRHPNDINRLKDYLNYGNNKLNIKYNTTLQYNYVAALNSTFALEALLAKKKVFTFGASAYLYPEEKICHLALFEDWICQVETENVTTLGSGSATVAGNKMAESKSRFLSWLMTNSLPGDLLNYRRSQLDLAVDIIIRDGGIDEYVQNKMNSDNLY